MLYLSLFLVLLPSVIDVFDILDLGPLLFQYSLFLLVFYFVGYSDDNSALTKSEVILLPPKPPRPRGYYAARRKHRHYFRRKCRSPVLIYIRPFRSPCLPDLLTPAEVNQLNDDTIARKLHKLLHKSWATFDLSYGLSLAEFVRNIDPLHSLRLTKSL
jgi:hypothetical protein